MVINTRPVSTSSFTEDTPKHYLLDSAAIFTNVTFDSTEKKFIGTPMGATDGGVELKVDAKYRDIEVDGTGHMDVMGNKVIESITTTATASLKEWTAEAIRQALNGKITDAGADEAPVGYKKVESKRYIEASDYLKNVAFVGKLSGSDNYMVAILDNALVTSGLEAKTKDKGEAVIEQEYTANASVEQLLKDEFPWHFYFPSDTPEEGAE